MQRVRGGRPAGTGLLGLLGALVLVAGVLGGCATPGPSARSVGHSWTDYLMPRIGFACALVGPRYGGRPGDGYVVTSATTSTLARRVRESGGTSYTVADVSRITTDYPDDASGPDDDTERVVTSSSYRVDAGGALRLGDAFRLGAARVAADHGGLRVPPVDRLAGFPGSARVHLTATATPAPGEPGEPTGPAGLVGLAGSLAGMTADGTGRIGITATYAVTGQRISELSLPGLGRLRDLVEVSYRVVRVRFDNLTAAATRQLVPTGAAAEAMTTHVWFARGLGAVRTVLTGGPLASTTRATRCG